MVAYNYPYSGPSDDALDYRDKLTVMDPRFGAVPDYRVSAGGGSGTAGSNQLTVTDGVFTDADKGKVISVPGGNTAARCLMATIAAVVSSTIITLSTPLITSVSNASPYWGTDNSTAINKAIEYLATPGVRPKTLVINDGTFLIAGPRLGPYSAILKTLTRINIEGESLNATLKLAGGYTEAGDYKIFAPLDDNPTDYVSWRKLTFDLSGADNKVLGSSGGNIRGAWVIHARAGINPRVEGCRFLMCPGRSIVNLGAIAPNPRITGGWVIFNEIDGAGAGIPGNELQNDHSSLYHMADGMVVGWNRMKAGPNVLDPGGAGFACCGIESHGSNNEIVGNRTYNYSTLGNSAGIVMPHNDVRWHHNIAKGLNGNAFTIWSLAGFGCNDLVFEDNVLEVDNTVYQGNSFIYQFPSNLATTVEVKGLVIRRNKCRALRTTVGSPVFYGFELVAIDGGVIEDNELTNVPGSAINIEAAQNPLMVRDVQIRRNKIRDAGMNSQQTSVWAVRIALSALDREFSNILIDDNDFIQTDTLPAAGAAQMRGVKIDGPGKLTDITVTKRNRTRNIPRLNRVEITNTGGNVRVWRELREVFNPRAADPTSGIFELGGEIIVHTDPVGAAAGAWGKAVTGSGGGSASAWVTLTNYPLRAWIRNAASTRFWEYVSLTATAISGGKTEATAVSGATEPAPGLPIGTKFVDGDYNCVLREQNLPVLRAITTIA